MVRRQRSWVYSPKSQAKPQVPEEIKTDLEKKANELIESFLKATYIKPPPEKKEFNYLVDIYSKWYRVYFYFCSKYCCPGPNAISPFFEDKFARLEYIGNGLFNLSYMRHTGTWWEMYQNLSIDECLAAIKNDPCFFP